MPSAPNKNTPADSPWAPRDLAFVAMELMHEFPGADATMISAAVKRAAEEVPVGQGRVQLTVAARKILRSN